MSSQSRIKNAKEPTHRSLSVSAHTPFVGATQRRTGNERERQIRTQKMRIISRQCQCQAHLFHPMPSLLLLLLFLALPNLNGPFCSSSSFLVEASSTAAGQETLIGIVGKDFILLGADSSSTASRGIALTASNVDKILVISNPFPNRHRISAHAVADEDEDEDEGSMTRTEEHSNPASVLRDHQQQQCIAAAAAGDSADSDRLLGLLKAHATIREYEAGIGCDVECVFPNNKKKRSVWGSPAGLDAWSIAHLARSEISSSLRSASPLNICLLIAGMVQSPTSVSTTAAHDDEDSLLQPCLLWLDNTGSLQHVLYGAHGHGSNFILSILDKDYKPNMSTKEALHLMQSCFQQLRTRYVINTGPYPPCIKCIDAKYGCSMMMTQDQDQVG